MCQRKNFLRKTKIKLKKHTFIWDFKIIIHLILKRYILTNFIIEKKSLHFLS